MTKLKFQNSIFLMLLIITSCHSVSKNEILLGKCGEVTYYDNGQINKKIECPSNRPLKIIREYDMNGVKTSLSFIDTNWSIIQTYQFSTDSCCVKYYFIQHEDTLFNILRTNEYVNLSGNDIAILSFEKKFINKNEFLGKLSIQIAKPYFFKGSKINVIGYDKDEKGFYILKNYDVEKEKIFIEDTFNIDYTYFIVSDTYYDSDNKNRSIIDLSVGSVGRVSE